MPLLFQLLHIGYSIKLYMCIYIQKTQTLPDTLNSFLDSLWSKHSLILHTDARPKLLTGGGACVGGNETVCTVVCSSVQWKMSQIMF